MEKTIKVRCIDDKCFAQLTENKVYEVKNSFKSDGELFYNIVDDDGDYVSMFSSRFEIVEEKPVMIKIPSLEALQNNMTDMINRNLCSEKPVMYDSVETWAKFNKHKIAVPWTLAKTHNLIDRFNRMKCTEKPFKGMHVPYMRDIVENLHEMKAPSMPEKLRSQSIKVIVLDEVDVYPLTDINLNNEIDSFNRHLKCNTHHIETPPDKKVEYHEPGFKSKWDTVGI